MRYSDAIRYMWLVWLIIMKYVLSSFNEKKHGSLSIKNKYQNTHALTPKSILTVKPSLELMKFKAKYQTK